MADLKVNAEQVIATADRIKNLNMQMRDAFPDVENAMNKLDVTWDSAAATSAFSKFNAIKNAYCDARYSVVDNYVAFLYQQVGEGYIQTEDVNKTLAEQFK